MKFVLTKKQSKILLCCELIAVIIITSLIVNLKPSIKSDAETQNFDNKTIVIYPIFTQYAYSKNGFYDYYHGVCGTRCLTVDLYQNNTGYKSLKTTTNTIYWINPTTATSINGFYLLQKLNYHFITDIDIDKNPHILDSYDKIILLHNEYVTQKEYDAIMKKNRVIYLYPDALFVEIKADYSNNTMTLISGHGYPKSSIGNTFDHTRFADHEKDYSCIDLHWEKLKNGIELSCYPEFALLNNSNLLETIKDWPFLHNF